MVGIACQVLQDEASMFTARKKRAVNIGLGKPAVDMKQRSALNPYGSSCRPAANLSCSLRGLGNVLTPKRPEMFKYIFRAPFFPLHGVDLL